VCEERVSVFAGDAWLGQTADMRRPLRLGSLVSLCTLGSVLALGSGCNNAVVVELQSGAQTFELNAASLNIPPSLRDTGSNTVASIDCSVSGICPSSAEVGVACTGGLCNPDPLTVAVQVGDVVDFTAILNSAGTLIRIVDTLEVIRAEYQVSPNALTIELPAVEILWAPETALSADGATLLGTIPAIGAMTAVNGDMAIDGAGSAALSDYVLGSSGRVRFFARATIDLEPGGPFPDGTATATVNLRIRATGRIID
jgi:hypothetical protein